MTNSTLSCGTQCFLTFIASYVLWLAIASVLLWQTWNQVIAFFFKVKSAKFTQALLVLLTVSALVLPCAYLKKECRKGHCKDERDCSHQVSTENCPYAHDKSK